MTRVDAEPRFISLRWRLVVPFAVVTVIMMVMVYAPVAAAQASPAARQIAGLSMATGAATVIIIAYLGTLWQIARLERIRAVAQRLSAGDPTARTHMTGSDEIGLIGSALDVYADHVQQKQDALRVSLRRQRREIEHLTGVLDALPDGVIVQDGDGRVIFMNELAKSLLGKANSELDTLTGMTATVTDILGAALAPGLYALGDPRHVHVGGKVIHARAAALLSVTRQRVGTVIVLRDATDEVRRERAREVALAHIEAHAQAVELAAGMQNRPQDDVLSRFARELSRHAIGLQKLVVEMRELMMEARVVPAAASSKPLNLETLIWAVANEWRQVAQAANLRMDVIVEQKGLHVLGDERRLRWALGNIVDNAIKYTPPGGAFSLEIKTEEDGRARLRIRDNGTGILPEELPRVFERFFRGTPVTKEGRTIRAPGTGQGLTVSQQIIEAHGGTVKMKSAVGIGTAVYITLPLTAPVGYELPSHAADDSADSETLQIQPGDFISPQAED
ncbi:HAMP domain-containing protein [Anaerolineae bacterium CFX9]|jgi:signal transduction histidine kinase|nr:HAMP domain-containing protein [Anaerolineae bacterium CFX9]